MSKNYNFEDFKSIMSNAIAKTDYYDHSDEQMRQIWADNIYEWGETHSREELLSGLKLLTEYSNGYQEYWENSWIAESFGKEA